MRNKVSVIIPVFNEEKNVRYVLDEVTRSGQIDEIICINDGSTDRTGQILANTKSISVISLDKNYGKSYAIAAGIREAKGEIVVLLDGDLRGLSESIFHILITPLVENTHDVVIGYPSKAIDKLFKPISGQRAYFKRDLMPLLDLLENKGYGLELFLNFEFRQRRIKTVVLPGVYHIVKHKKQPLKKAFKWYIAEIKEIFSEIFLQENPFAYFANTYIFPFYWQKQVIRVLFVFDSLSPIGGGSQVAALMWMRNLREQNVVVKILCNANAKKFIPELSNADTIELPYLNLHKLFPHYYPTFFLTSRVKREIKRFAPNIIHVHEPTLFSSKVISLAKNEGIPTIFSFQTDYSKQTTTRFPISLLLGKRSIGKKILSWWEYYICRQVDYITVPSEFYKNIIATKVHKNARVILLPIYKNFYKLEKVKKSNVTNLISVSRLIENKHIDVLIAMMQYLDSSFHLTVIGDGPDKKYLRHLSKKMNLQQRVTFIDWVPLVDLPNVLSNADVYLSASDSETFGLTYLSALASQTPCVVYDYPVSREIIPKNSSLFLRTLDPHIWAQTIKDLQANPATYQQLCQNIIHNYGVLEKYNEYQSTKELLSMYKDIVKAKLE